MVLCELRNRILVAANAERLRGFKNTQISLLEIPRNIEDELVAGVG
jgi:hypothetical protein